MTYNSIAVMNINLGRGGDTFVIQNTGAAATNLTTLSTITSVPESITVQNDSGTTNITTGNGAEKVNIQATEAGGSTTVTTGTGGNTINLGSNAPGVGGFLDDLHGAIVLHGNGANTVVNLDDTGTAVAKTGQLTATTITGLGTGGVTYSGVGTLNINLGNQGNTFTIVSTNASTTTTVNGGSGADVVTIQSDSGPTNVNAGGGNDTVTIQSDSAATNINTGAGNDIVNVLATSDATGINTGDAGADVINIGSLAPTVTGGTLAGIQGVVSVVGDGSDTVNADDSVVTAAVTVNLSASVLSVSNAANINYGGLSKLNVSLGSGNNIINVTGTSAASNTSISAGNGNDSFTVVPSTNTPTSGLLTLSGPLTLSPGLGTNSLTVNDSADPVVRSVTVTGTSISGLGGPINYANVQTLTILLGTAAGNSVTIGNGAGALPINTTIQNGSTTGGTATVTYTGDFTGNLTLVNFANGSMSVTGNFLGNLAATAIGSITILGSVDTGTINVGTINSIWAPALTSIAGNNDVVLQVIQGGVLRQVQAGVEATGGTNIASYYSALPVNITFAVAYDGSTIAGVPQAAIRINNPTTTSFDIALTSASVSTKFDLSRLDASTTTGGVLNVTVEGDLLSSPTSSETARSERRDRGRFPSKRCRHRRGRPRQRRPPFDPGQEH